MIRDSHDRRVVLSGCCPGPTFEALESRTLCSAATAAATLVRAPLFPVDANDHTADFGHIGTRSVTASVVDELTGLPVTLRLSGPGVGQVTVTSEGLNVSITGVNATSSLIVRSTGAAQLHNVSIAGSIARIDAGAINLDGDLTVSGGVGRMSFGDVSGGHDISIGIGTKPGRFTFQNINQLSIDSLEPIALLSARQWTEDPASRGHVIAPYFGSVQIAGNFEANLTATQALHGVSIGQLLVEGAIDGAQIRAVLDLQKAIIGQLIDSNIFAGVAMGLATAPTSTGDFTSKAAIGDIRVVGAAGTQTVIGSNIAASTIGTIKLGPVDGSNNGSSFGVAAERIGSYRRGPVGISGTGLLTLKRLHTPGVIDSKDDYALTIL